MKNRLSSESGIAIGVILFALAIIAAVTIAMSASNSMMSTSSVTAERIIAEVKSQGDLILTKIRQCYSEAVSDEQTSCANNAYDAVNLTWSRPACSSIDRTAYYPAGASPGVLVSSVTCPGYNSSNGTNLWTGRTPSMLPPPSTGLADWVYVNAGDSGGRCIRIQPLPSTVNDAAVRNGLLQAANGFGAAEYVYTPGSASQRFIIWVTRPSGSASADCAP